MVPKWVDPVINSTEDVMVCATIVCAVRVPLTIKLSADDAVTAFSAQLAVPNRDPVNPFVADKDPVNSC